MGYIGHKRSVRSQQAIDSGLVIYSQLKSWQKRAVDSNAVFPVEWHHTGKFFQKTYYYDPNDFEGLDPKDFPRIIAEKEAETGEKWYVLVSAKWGGTKRYPKIEGADIKVVNKLTKAQKDAKKYYMYGGYIQEFDNRDEAEEFSKTAKLKN